MAEFYTGDDFYIEDDEYSTKLSEMDINEAVEEVSCKANIEELDRLKNGYDVNTPLMRETESDI